MLIFILILTLFFLALTVKGNKNSNNAFKNQKGFTSELEGPFEASNTRSRFALTVSLIEEKSIFLNRKLASFSAPDVVKYKEKFISIFPPAVALLAIPLYLLGKLFGLPQLFAFLTGPLLAFANMLLVIHLSGKLKIGIWTAFLSGFIFLFGTNAFSYAQTLTQHHLTVTVFLLALITALGKRTFLNNMLFGILFGLGILTDIPNAIVLLPALIYIIYKELNFKYFEEKIRLNISVNILGLLLGILPLISFLGWYNYKTTGSYTLLAQSIGRTKVFEGSNKPDGRPPLPFQSRQQLRGAYTLFLSDERSWLYYSPIVILGLLGFLQLIKNEYSKDFAIISLAIIFVNGTLYSLFPDPWGGWAFGPRYLIPAAALLSIGLSVLFDVWKKYWIFILVFVLLGAYSIFVNTLGATTSTMIPPKVEAVSLPDPIPHTYLYNLNLLSENRSGLLLYNLYFANIINKAVFTYILAASIISAFLLVLSLAYRENKNINAIKLGFIKLIT